MSPPFVHVAWPTAITSFPTVEATATFWTEEQGTNMLITLPANIAAGDLLVMFANTPATSGSSVPVAPSGWSTLYATPFDGGSINCCACFYKTATGSEGSTVEMALTWSRLSAVTYRISGWDTAETPEAGTPAKNSASTSPNPPSLTPSWGSDKTLWLAASHSSAGSSVSYPTNYSNGITAYSELDNAYHVRTAAAERTLEATSEDPGVFTLGSSATWVANTVAVRGAAA